MVMGEGRAWRKMGLFNHLYSCFTSLPFSPLFLNTGICSPSLSSKKTSSRCHLIETKSIASNQRNTEAKDMVKNEKNEKKSSCLEQCLKFF